MKSIISILSLLFVLSFAELSCPDGQYINENNKCKFCPSGYYCPDGIIKVKCPDGTYSDVGEEKCQECGCEGCLQSNIINETTKEIVKYAGSCTTEGTCYPGFGMNPETKSCRKCRSWEYSIGGSMECVSCPSYSVHLDCEEPFCFKYVH